MQSVALQGVGYYPLDNSAIIHIATRNKTYSNIFRLSANLKENVNPDILQEALNIITPRFPTIVAGLRGGLFNYTVVSVVEPLKVQRERSSFTSLSKEEMNKCALRVFYTDDTISVEFFHSLTDGRGGLVFFNTLLAEYMKLKYGLKFGQNNDLLDPFDKVSEKEVRNDYARFAKFGKSTLSCCAAYKLPGVKSKDRSVQTFTGTFDLTQLVNLSHRYNTTLTVFLTAVLYDSIFNLQTLYKNERSRKPIRVMIPVDLRKKFQSKTLRNFTLYIIPKMGGNDRKKSFEQLIEKVKVQFDEQNNNERYAAIMGDYEAKNKSTFLSYIPMPLKCLILRCAYKIFGDNSTSITLSNLGKVDFPSEVEDFVNEISFALTPKIKSNYNCSVVSFQNKLYISFSSRYIRAELADIFFRKLENFGITHYTKSGN